MSLPIANTAVIAIAPELAGLGSTIDPFIPLADLQIDPDAWGPFAELAEAYLVAHMMVLSGAGPYAGQGGARFSGVLSKIGVGQTSVEAMPISAELVAAPNLVLSKFGLMYDGLLKGRGLTFVVP
jgi:hypothetical protein